MSATNPMPTYDARRTALLFVDPYNDFLSEGGKLWPMLAEVANSVRLHEKLRSITAAVRAAGIPVFIVPHHRARPDDFAGWDHPTPYQLGAAKIQVFAEGSWAASGIRISPRSPATSWSRSTGVPAASPTPTSTCC